ncbi:MAG: pantetheine-phosphate adenylyltransferase [Clostridia bacterium]|nr:pantetheine-phosphate adenylyltransferase [Clostridia bacterium]
MKIAICPGSFDPVTKGHLDVIKRASKLFDKVIVVVMQNVRKKDSNSFTVEERLDFIKRCTCDIGNVETDSYVGLLADYAREKNAAAIVKGLRAVSDFEDEFQQSLTNMRLNPDVETVFITAKSEYMFLSSSVVKQVAGYGGEVDDFIPAQIIDEVNKRLNHK